MKIFKALISVCVLVAVMLAANSNALACSCLSLPVCWELNLGTTIFVGKLVQASQAKVETYGGKSEVRHTGELLFEVVEPFSGVTEKTITVWSDGYGCGSVGHQLGETYLVFAKPAKDHPLVVRPCSTFPVAQYLTEDKQPTHELKTLRDVAQRKGDGARISGMVYVKTNNSMNGGKEDTKYLPGIEVKIEGEGREFIVVTNQDGWYEVKGLKPGKYFVSMSLPEGMLFAKDEKSRQEITLREFGCASTGFQLLLNSGLRGIVKDEDGKPVVGITVNLLPSDLKDQIDLEDFEKPDREHAVATDGNGEYRFNSILPGEYLVAVNFDGANSAFPYTRTFYPQTTEARKAQVIKVEPGTDFGSFDLRLAKKLPAKAIEGSVVWLDGTPVVGASVRMSLPGDYRSEDEADTDEKGHFVLKAILNRDYEIKVYWHDDEGVSGKIKPSPLGWQNATSERERITVTEDIKGLKFVLTNRQR